ncbi:type VII secretion-associated protein [Corynebacterium sp. S7]
MNSILISIQPSVTVITAETAFYRYDNPSPAELADYLLTLIQTDASEYTVAISADAELAAQVAEECAARSFQISTFSLHDDAPAPDPEPALSEDSAIDSEGPALGEISRPLANAENMEPKARRGSMIVLSIAVVGVLGAGLWAVATTIADDNFKNKEAVVAYVAGEEHPPSQVPSEPSEPSEPSAEVADDVVAEPDPGPDTVVLNEAGLSVELPTGFQLSNDGDMWKAEGNDPDLRLQLAVDDLFGLPVQELLSQVEADIEQDPDLSLISVDAARIEYHQNAPDGSEATWITWVEDGKQVSLGCHTRFAPSTVQRATCSMARDSADFSAEPAN